MYLPQHQLILKWNGIAHSLTNDVRTKVMGLSRGSVIVREGLLGGTIHLFTATLKMGQWSVILNAIKDLRVSFSLPIGFEMKCHNSRSEKYTYN